MARRALAAVALLALGIAGAAAAAGLASGAARVSQPVGSCAASTAPASAVSSTSAATGAVSTAITTVGRSGTTTVTPLGPAGATATATPAGCGAAQSATASTATTTTSGSSSTLVITGHGWGHGIGMGQWGAYGYALHGWTYEQILHHYYRGTTIGTGPSPTVRVLLDDGTSSTTVSSASTWRAVDSDGTRLALPAGKLVLTSSLRLEGRKLVSPLTFEPGSSPLELGGAAYHGNLVVSSNGSTLEVVNAVGLEAYLDGVVGAEMPASWPQAALEAQAVAARSYALAELATVVTASPFDLYDDTRSQVYGGISAEAPSVEQAVAATAHQVVLYHGKVATTYFSASSGGETVSAAEALGTPIPYLVSVTDPYDTLSPEHDWGPVLIGAAAAGKALGLGGPVVDLTATPGPSGHIARVVATGPDGERTFTGAQVRDDLGLRSDWFAFAWLALSPPPGPVSAGAAVSLSGIARGLKDVSLEERLRGGSWQPVGPVSAKGDGPFTVRVRPAQTTQYRLAAGAVRGALIEVRVG